MSQNIEKKHFDAKFLRLHSKIVHRYRFWNFLTACSKKYVV